MEPRLTRLIRLASLVVAFGAVSLVAGRATVVASDLTALVAEYEAAKKQHAASRARGGRGGGRRGGPGGRQRREADPPSLEALLERIARVGTKQSLGYLQREYHDPDSEIASLSGVAILQTNQDGRARVVAQGYNRGGRWTPGQRARVLDVLVVSGGQEGLEFVIRLASRASVEERSLALVSLSLRPNDGDVQTVLLEAIEHRATGVRSAALRALRPLRSKAAIGALIGRLEREKEEALRLDVLRLLVGMTDQNLGLVAADWEKWWQYAEAGFVFNEKPSTRTVVVTPDLQYFGIEVASKRVCFLVDASLSMESGGGNRRGGRGPGGGGRGGGGQDGGGPDGGAGGGGRRGGGGKAKIDQMKDELSRILGELPPESFVNIVSFHHSPFPWKKELHSLKGRGRDEAIQFVRGLRTGFGTNIYDTLELALSDQRVDTIFLLSDGRPVGGRYSEPADILREIGAINRVRGAKIHTIGFGRETGFLKDLAAQNGGEYRAVDP